MHLKDFVILQILQDSSTSALNVFPQDIMHLSLVICFCGAFSPQHSVLAVFVRKQEKENTKYIFVCLGHGLQFPFHPTNSLIVFHHLFMLLSLTSIYSSCSLVFSCSSSTKLKLNTLPQSAVEVNTSRSVVPKSILLTTHCSHCRQQQQKLLYQQPSVSARTVCYSGIIYAELCFSACCNLGISVQVILSPTWIQEHLSFSESL